MLSPIMPGEEEIAQEKEALTAAVRKCFLSQESQCIVKQTSRKALFHERNVVQWCRCETG